MSALRWLIVLVAVAAAVWVVSLVTRRWEQPANEARKSPAE